MPFSQPIPMHILHGVDGVAYLNEDLMLKVLLEQRLLEDRIFRLQRSDLFYWQAIGELNWLQLTHDLGIGLQSHHLRLLLHLRIDSRCRGCSGGCRWDLADDGYVLWSETRHADNAWFGFRHL